MARIGRLTFPVAMLAFPFYLRSRSPGKAGSHYDPKSDLFVPAEAPLVYPEAFIVSNFHQFCTHIAVTSIAAVPCIMAT